MYQWMNIDQHSGDSIEFDLTWSTLLNFDKLWLTLYVYSEIVHDRKWNKMPK